VAERRVDTEGEPAFFNANVRRDSLPI